MRWCVILDVEFKKGILFVRVNGILVSSKIKDFENEVLPIILGLNVKYVTINLKNTVLIDKNGINSLIKISNLTQRNDGKTVVCDINDNIKNTIKHSDLFDYCFKSKTELSSSEVFSIW